jgi:hypothetical protein
MNTEIMLRESQTETDTSWLKAKINENGSLVLEGYDIGEAPLNYWGRDEYEYWRTVDSKYKDSILLLLIKDRFTSDSGFSQWLEEKVFQVNFIIGYNYPANREVNNNALTCRMACLIVVWYELARFRKGE